MRPGLSLIKAKWKTERPSRWGQDFDKGEQKDRLDQARTSFDNGEKKDRLDQARTSFDKGEKKRVGEGNL